MGPTKNQNKDDFRITAKKCQFYDRGYCRYKEKSTNKHPDKVCDDPNCSVDKCDKIHPNPCKYGPRCRFSKKKLCLYSHDTLVCDDSKMDALAKKVEAFEKQISVLSKKLDNFVELGKHVDRKIEALDNTVNNNKKASIENNARTEKLENLVKKMETRLNKLESGEIDKKVTDLENIIKKQQKKNEHLEVKIKALEAFYNEKLLKCTQCEFATVSEKGLKTHVVKKHKTEKKKKEDTFQYPRSCDLCEKEIKNKIAMKTHMKTHSYKDVLYQCNKCDFLGGAEMDIAVHSGKAHGDCFACGLCEYIAPDLETLETHLFTCEIFECYNCETIFKSLGDLKSHFVEHESSSKHTKQSRENADEYESTRYTYKEIMN